MTLSREVGTRPAMFGLDCELLVPILSIGPRLTILSIDGQEDSYIASVDPIDYGPQQIVPASPLFVPIFALAHNHPP
jgi:hypothetical protein